MKLVKFKQEAISLKEMDYVKGGERTINCSHNINTAAGALKTYGSNIKLPKINLQNTSISGTNTVLNHIGWKIGVKCK